MFLPSKFYIHKETEEVIEFREKKSTLYIGCLVLIVLGLIFLISFFPNCPAGSWWETIVLISIGVGPIILGLVPMLTIGKIVIDKNKKTLLFMAAQENFF